MLEKRQIEVSTIVPTKNSRGTLGHVLRSVRNMDFDLNKIESIVVDFESADRTWNCTKERCLGSCIRRQCASSFQPRIETGSGKGVSFVNSDALIIRSWLDGR